MIFRRLLVAGLLPVMVLAGDAPERQAWRLPLAPVPHDTLAAFRLTAEVFDKSTPGLADLRLVDTAGTVIPYTIENETAAGHRAVRTPQTAEVAEVHETAGNGLVVIARLTGDEPAAQGFTVVTPLTDFERRVLVEGSADNGATWRPLVTAAPLFDRSRYTQISCREVALPTDNRATLFRITFDAATETLVSDLAEITRSRRQGQVAEETDRTATLRRAFHFDRIEFWRVREVETPRQTVMADYAPAEWIVTVDAGKRQTVIQATLRNEPVTRFRIAAAPANYQRRIRVLVPWHPAGGMTEWRVLADSEILQVALQGYVENRSDVEFPETAAREYRLEIFNEDNPPLQISGGRAFGPARRVLFEARAGERYYLLFGDPQAVAPRYDFAAVLARLRDHGVAVPLTVGATGPVEANPGLRPASLWDRLPRRGLLWGGMTLMLAGLAWGMWHATQSIGKLPENS